MDVRKETVGLNYEAEYNRLKEEMTKQKEENAYLCKELKNKEKSCSITMGLNQLAN